MAVLAQSAGQQAIRDEVIRAVRYLGTDAAGDPKDRREAIGKAIDVLKFIGSGLEAFSPGAAEVGVAFLATIGVPEDFEKPAAAPAQQVPNSGAETEAQRRGRRA